MSHSFSLRKRDMGMPFVSEKNKYQCIYLYL